MHSVSHRVESRKTTHKQCFRRKDAAAINEEQDKNIVVRSSLPRVSVFLSLVKSVKLTFHKCLEIETFTDEFSNNTILTKLFRCSQKVKMSTNC